METKDYTVTDLAGPYVAGRQAKRGAKVTLTEAQAQAELLSGAIVPEGKDVAEAFGGTKRLAGIQAAAKGYDSPEEAEQAEQEPPADPPGEGAGKPAGRKGATPPATPPGA